MSKIPVQALYDKIQELYNMGVGYIYGTAGVICTQKTIDDCITRFPNNAAMTERYGKQWIGKLVMDCSGLFVYLWKQYGLYIPHGSTSMVKQKYIVDCGPVPHPGWAALVDPTPDTPDNNHIGFVDKDGETIWECKGTKDGLVKSNIHDKRWTKFGRFKDVDYGEGSEIMPSDDGTRVYYKARVNTTSGPLNVRSGPGTDNDVIFKLPKGTVVDVMFEYESGWAFVDEDGDQGYVKASYLLKVEDTPKDVPEEKPNDPITILTRADGVTITLKGEWTVEKGD